MFYNFLFPQYLRGRAVSLILLLIRIFFAVMFFMHGLDKMRNFDVLSETFPSIMGLGSYTTLMLAIFCEFACSLFLMTGLITRIILIPMILSMAVAFFDVHDGMMPQGELSLIYLIVFFGLFICGPGRYSVDYLIDKRLQKDRQNDEEAARTLNGKA
ncbi:MAG: DoxX family protein [Bacteroidales bacterium]|nr:DoxX family protein [Bacteroidales bacterium]